MSNSPFDFSQLSTPEEPLARRRKGSRATPIALAAAAAIVCGGAWWLLRNVAQDAQPQQAAVVAKKVEPLPASTVAQKTVLPPSLAEISDLTVDDERPVVCQVSVQPDEDGGEVRFSLAQPAPRGAHVDPKSGEFRWKPGAPHRVAGLRGTSVGNALCGVP
jgi:hypothetical protein